MKLINDASRIYRTANSFIGNFMTFIVKPWTDECTEETTIRLNAETKGTALSIQSRTSSLNTAPF